MYVCMYIFTFNSKNLFFFLLQNRWYFVLLYYQIYCLLNPHSGYVKTDVYLMQFLYHMASDVKFSHMFFFLIYSAVQKLYSTKQKNFTIKKY